MTIPKVLTSAVALAVAANTRVPVLPGWAVPFPSVVLAVVLAAVTGLAVLLVLRVLPARPALAAPLALPAKVLSAVRRNCVYCGNTGTVGGAWCPLCRPDGGEAR